MTTRTVNISLLEQVPQKRTLVFMPRLASVDGDVLLQRAYSVTTNASGDATIALPVKAVGNLRYDYEIPREGGKSVGHFYLAAGSAIDLDDLIVAGGTASDSVIEYVDEAIANIPGGTGNVAADVIFDLKGDLPVGTGANTAARLPAGANGTFLTPNSALATGLEWITPSAVKTLLNLAKADVGLGNVDNTSDANKPVSTAQAAADTAAIATANAYADSLVVGLIDDRGNYNASGNVFPSSGGSGAAGAVKKGDLWTIQAGGGGTIGGIVVTPGDLVRSLIDTPGQTAANWAVTENNIGYVAENLANKDASNGYAGLTLLKINFWNVLGTFKSFFTNANTAARTYTFQNRDGTIADDTDITAAKARANHTGTQTASTVSDFNAAALAAAPAETVTTVGGLINGATAKTVPVAADQLALMDSAASNVVKKLAWSDVKDRVYIDPFISMMQGLGSPIVGQNYDISRVSTNSSIVNGVSRWIAINIPVARTITGIYWYQWTKGSYTSANNNRIGLYSYAGGTCTPVASTTHDAALWSTYGNDAVGNKDFTTPYPAAAGTYYVCLLFCQSALTTAPLLGVQPSHRSSGWNFTNNAKLAAEVSGLTDLPGSQATSGFVPRAEYVWIGWY